MRYIHFISSKGEEYLTPNQLIALESAFLVYKDCFPFAHLYENTWKNVPDYFVKVTNIKGPRDNLKALVCYLYGGIFIETYLYANLNIQNYGNKPIITKNLIYAPERENPCLGYILTNGKGWSKMKEYTKYFLSDLPPNHLEYLREYYDYSL